jgi:hypothetical protein
MAEPRIAPFSPDEFARHHALIQRIAERYRAEPAFRSSLEGNARTELVSLGLNLPEGLEVRVVANTDDVAYFVMPPDPNVELADESLLAVAGGSSAGSTGSASTISTLMSIPGTFSSAGTAGTIGTAGSN